MIRRSDNEFQDICTTFGVMTLMRLPMRPRS